MNFSHGRGSVNEVICHPGEEKLLKVSCRVDGQDDGVPTDVADVVRLETATDVANALRTNDQLLDKILGF
jgi:hypothetical protein